MNLMLAISACNSGKILFYIYLSDVSQMDLLIGKHKTVRQGSR